MMGLDFRIEACLLLCGVPLPSFDAMRLCECFEETGGAVCRMWGDS